MKRPDPFHKDRDRLANLVRLVQDAPCSVTAFNAAFASANVAARRKGAICGLGVSRPVLALQSVLHAAHRIGASEPFYWDLLDIAKRLCFRISVALARREKPSILSTPATTLPPRKDIDG